MQYSPWLFKVSTEYYTAGTAVSMCVTLQRAAREVSGKCYQNIANMKLECSFRCWPLEQEGGEAENISNFEHFSKYNVQHFVSYKFLNIIHDYIH